MKHYPIVMIDDESFYLEMFAENLGEPFRVHGATNLAAGLALIRQIQPMALLLDIALPEKTEGLDALPQITRAYPNLPVFMLSNHDRLSFYRQAVDNGVVAYFIKKSDPVSQIREILVQHLCQNNHKGIIAESPAMKMILNTARQFAKSDMNILITGETGVGKDIIARYIHDVSHRAGEMYQSVNCAALEHSLMRSELFGYEQGAFTGAKNAHRGIIETGNGGTLFLNEIAEMDASDQAVLLKMLEDGEIRRVGSATHIKVDVRIIAATHQLLQERIQDGRFRQDLYYRLATLTLEIPPLRERIADIIPLAELFLEKYSAQEQKSPKVLGKSAKVVLQAYQWPGNIRELEQLVRRVVITCNHREITGNDLLIMAPKASQEGDYKTAVSQFRANLLRDALFRHKGNISQTAKVLGLSRNGLQKLIRELAIIPEL